MAEVEGKRGWFGGVEVVAGASPHVSSGSSHAATRTCVRWRAWEGGSALGEGVK